MKNYVRSERIDMKKYQFDPAVQRELESLRAPLAVYQFIDKRVVTIILSDGFCEMFGYTDRDLAYYEMDNNMYKDTHPDDVSRIANEAFRFATQGGEYEVVYRTLTQNHTDYKIIHSRGEHVYTEDGVRLAYVWYTDEGSYTADNPPEQGRLTDIFRNVLREESLINATYFDYLTGLPSMSYFFELADEWRKNSRKENETAAILYMDLCGMKFFNRKHGFAQGDELLRSFAAILKSLFSSENCSRFGSDHFCVFTTTDGLEDKLRELFARLESLGESNALPVRVGISLDESGKHEISRECDRAKFASDSMGSLFESRFCYFDDKMLKKTEKTQHIINNLDRAMAEGWIQVYHQPIIRAANGKICGEEALARWFDPEKGTISPAEFIPILEEARLVYKLDLFVLDESLKKIKKLSKMGYTVVSESINLSRVDFDCCDIVEEIRRRVDDAGIDRSLVNIELTETSVGNDFDFMKAQIERFRSLGFKVWMDDFGSGYSSLDVLQSLKFDLIKFDMKFMKEFQTNEKSKIILTELIKMAIALDIDTVCEGVETTEQVNFLRMVGCTKLQGFYYSTPLPCEEIIRRHTHGAHIGFEKPEEAEYYAAIGKINLYDLAILSNDDEETFENYFNTLPMAIIESDGNGLKLVRCNNSYRKFMENSAGLLNLGEFSQNDEYRVENGFIKALRECGKTTKKLLIDEELDDGSVIHAFIKSIATNPSTGTRALAVAVLAVMDGKSSPISFTHVAKALSSDYISLYYVNLKTDRFVEYKSDPLVGELAVERRGRDYFEQSREDAKKLLSGDDLGIFLETFTKPKVTRAIELHGAFTLSYKMLLDGTPTYVNMKAVRTKSGIDHLIIGISNIDAQIRQKQALERMIQERTTYSRISALWSEFVCIYTVDPETDDYFEYSTTDTYEELTMPKQGKLFFDEAYRQSERLLFKDDIEFFKTKFSKSAVLEEIEKSGLYTLEYRLIINGEPTEVKLRAAIAEEKDGPQLIIGVTRKNRR